MLVSPKAISPPAREVGWGGGVFSCSLPLYAAFCTDKPSDSPAPLLP